jgi:hypothetical protein
MSKHLVSNLQQVKCHLDGLSKLTTNFWSPYGAFGNVYGIGVG